MPGQRLLAVAPVPPLGAHEYVNGPEPVAVAVAVPVQPEQPELVDDPVTVIAVEHARKSTNTPES